MEKEKQNKWIFIRNGEVTNVFPNRKKAIENLKGLLTQTLKDIDSQDKTDEYDYPIKIYEIELKPIKERPIYLGL